MVRNRIFNKKQLVTNAVAEHVFEHLTVKEMRSSLKNIYNNLSSGGVLRIAFPDGNHTDEQHAEMARWNGRLQALMEKERARSN